EPLSGRLQAFQAAPACLSQAQPTRTSSRIRCHAPAPGGNGERCLPRRTASARPSSSTCRRQKNGYYPLPFGPCLPTELLLVGRAVPGLTAALRETPKRRRPPSRFVLPGLPLGLFPHLAKR